MKRNGSGNKGVSVVKAMLEIFEKAIFDHSGKNREADCCMFCPVIYILCNFFTVDLNWSANYV